MSGELNKKKYPLVAKLVYLLIYLFVPTYMNFFTVWNGRVTHAQHLQVISSPIYILYCVFYMGITITGFIILNKYVNSFDGTKESADRINKHYKILSFLTIGLVLLNSVLYAVVYCLVCKIKGFTSIDFGPYLMVWIGETLIWGMLFYLIWMKITDKFFSFIPLEKKDIILPITMKFTIVSAFSTIAVFLLSSEALFVKANTGVNLPKVFYTQVLPLGMTGVIVITIDFILLATIVIEELRKINKFTKIMAEGDYTQEEIKVEARDEVGIIVESLNTLHKNTRALLQGLDSSIQISTDASERSELSMDDISASTSQIVTDIDEVKSHMSNQSAGVEEASGAINQIIGNIKGLGSTIEAQSAAVEESSAAVRQMVANIQSVTSILERNEISTNQLQAASEQGQKLVKDAVGLSEQIIAESSGLLEASNVIQNIASQTNLLAMNAAIEAAHAGDLGKGFAVVADEIRNLAEQSNVQGKKITGSLKGLETVIEGVAASIKNLETQFDSIYDLTHVVQQQEEVVMNAMKEQSEGSNQVLLAIKSIDDSTLEVKQGSEEMIAGTTQIAKEMELLSNSTVETNRYVGEMAVGAGHIIECVEKGHLAAQETTGAIGDLAGEMNKFKL